MIACANQTPTQLADDVASLAGGVAGAAQTLRDGGYLSAQQLAQIDDAVSALQAAAVAVAKATSQTETQGAVEQAVASVNAVVSALAGVKTLPQTVTTVLTAAQVILPTIEALAGLPATATAASASMTPGEALLVLKAAEQNIHP